MSEQKLCWKPGLFWDVSMEVLQDGEGNTRHWRSKSKFLTWVLFNITAKDDGKYKHTCCYETAYSKTGKGYRGYFLIRNWGRKELACREHEKTL